MLIVGAGPSGLYAGYYAGFRGLKIAIADMLELPGGQITALYPEKLIYDVAGFPSILGRDLVDQLVLQVEPFKPSWYLGASVESVQRTGERWAVTFSDRRAIVATVIVITGGIGVFSPRELPTGSEYVDRGLVYYVPHPSDLLGKHVVIVGGGDSAFDWALALEPIAASVVLVHRREQFRAHQHTIDQVVASSTELITSAEIEAIYGDPIVSNVAIRLSDGTLRELKADVVVAALGFVAQLGPLNNWGLEMENRHIVVDTQMRTNLPGIFAAGDITQYPGKVRLISVGFGEAATAVNNAAVIIDPSSQIFPGHSSDAP